MIAINGRHPYVVLVQVQDRSGRVHILRSKNCMQYVDPSIVNQQVRVFYADDAFKHYYVDLDPILGNVITH
jgi:hypothetical protein